MIFWCRLYKSGKPFDYVLFMDDDMEPEPDALLKLLAHKKDIVAAGCTLRMDPPKPNYRVYEPDTFSFREENGRVGQRRELCPRTDADRSHWHGVHADQPNALRKIADYYLNAEHEKRFLYSPVHGQRKRLHQVRALRP
jgi:glycosyltransferase involved in cell wall biosynthesis